LFFMFGSGKKTVRLRRAPLTDYYMIHTLGTTTDLLTSPVGGAQICGASALKMDSALLRNSNKTPLHPPYIAYT
jgi:hypothetical protein